MALFAMGLTISCVSFEPGIEVRVSLLAPRAAIGDGLIAAAVLVEEVELVPCEPTQPETAQPEMARDEAAELESSTFAAALFPTAYAHGTDAPPELLDLRVRQHHELDILAPGPGRYCGVLLHLGTTTEDAAWVMGERDRRAPQQDIYVPFNEAREYQRALIDDVVVDYDPRDWMLHGDFSRAFDFHED